MNVDPAAFWVVTIHDRTNDDLSFDLKDVLGALGDQVLMCEWYVTELDCTGDDVQRLCDDVERARAAGEGGILLSARDLLDAAEKAGQTLEAHLYGLRSDRRRRSLTAPGRALGIDSPDVILVITCLRGSAFEVVTRSRDHVHALKTAFRDVRDEDPANYSTVSGAPDP